MKVINKLILGGLLVASVTLTTNIKTTKADVSSKPYENEWQLVLSGDECMKIAKIVELEYGNGSYEAKCAIAETILNRVVDPRFPNNVQDVISSPGQFSTYKRIDRCIPSIDTCVCVVDVVVGKTDIIPIDYIYFNNAKIGRDVIKIDKHYHGR